MSQEEVRIMAEISKDKSLLKIFKEGLDFHAYTGAIISNKSYEEFSELNGLP